MRAYYFVGRLLRPFAIMSLYAYSYIFRVPRARIVLKNEDDDILFVKSWLSGDAWGLPGGGVDRHEDAASAAVRELKEETGIVLTKEYLQPLVTLRSHGHDEIVFIAHTNKSNLPAVPPNRFEIQDMAWFPATEVPRLEPFYRHVVSKMARRG